MVVQCGGDGDDSEDSEPTCSTEELTAGTYSFTLNDDGIDDDCDPPGLAELLEFLGYVQPGPYPIDLPGYQQLLTGPVQVTASLPFVGEQTGTLTLVDDMVGFSIPNPITVEDINIPTVGVVDITVNVTGTLCPDSTTRVEADFVAAITSTTPPIVTPCAMTFSATGVLP
jgi:hypothetical protein